MSNYCRKHKTSHFQGCRHCKIDDQQATIATQQARVEALEAAITQYVDYWGRGGACQNLTKALLDTKGEE